MKQAGRQTEVLQSCGSLCKQTKLYACESLKVTELKLRIANHKQPCGL